MKVNETPEKIYLVMTTRIIDEWRKKPSQYGHNIEYTRTDAFIEKAREYLEPKIWTMLLGCQKDTDEFMEDFKNYMKGE